MYLSMLIIPFNVFSKKIIFSDSNNENIIFSLQKSDQYMHIYLWSLSGHIFIPDAKHLV